MNRSILSGLAHSRYGHFHYPRRIDLTCPKCASIMVGINKEAPNDIEHFTDISSVEKIWKLTCSNCTFRKAATWEETKAFDLWIAADIRGVHFWAWNKNHLDMIICRLRNKELTNHPWRFFESYIHYAWLKKLSNEREIRQIEGLVNK